MLAYRPFEAWAPASDWTLGLPPGEAALSVAVGAAFAAVATSERLLRVYSAAGGRFCTCTFTSPSQTVSDCMVATPPGPRMLIIGRLHAPWGETSYCLRMWNQPLLAGCMDAWRAACKHMLSMPGYSVQMLSIKGAPVQACLAEPGHCHPMSHASGAAAGLPLSVTSLPGQPVALAAQGDQLAAVWHAGMPAADRDQCLHCSVLGVGAQAALHSGPLCLSAGASLQWLGFSEEGMLAAYDSKVGFCMQLQGMGMAVG